jgi:hypothetical protein
MAFLALTGAGVLAFSVVLLAMPETKAISSPCNQSKET